MVGWHHRLDRHEFEQATEVGDGQGGLACCSPWVCKELDTTVQLNYEILLFLFLKGFPDSSIRKESACNAGDPGSIPGLGRSS